MHYELRFGLDYFRTMRDKLLLELPSQQRAEDMLTRIVFWSYDQVALSPKQLVLADSDWNLLGRKYAIVLHQCNVNHC